MKLNLLKTLLVAAGLLTSASGAWAEEITATLVHTASTYCSASATPVYGTVDSETEHYNLEGSSVWQGYAFAEFSFSLPDGATLTSATLKWTATSAKTYPSSLYCLNPNINLDYDVIGGDAPALLRHNAEKVSVDAGVAMQNNVAIETDVLSAVQNIIANSQDYVIFQWTANNGGADLYGKASDKAPVLTLTYSLAALYTATFTESNGLNPVVTVYTDETRTTTVPANTLSDNTTYYYTATLDGYEDYNGSFTVNSADPSVSFTMTEKARFTYSVNLVDENNAVVKTVYSADGLYGGMSISYSYPKYLTDADGKVTHVCNLTTYAGSVSPEAAGSTDIPYTTYNGTAYFVEVEDAGTAMAVGIEDNRLSSGKAVRGSASTSAIMTVKESGIYKMTYAVFTTNVNNVRPFAILKNDETIVSNNAMQWSINYVQTTGTISEENISLLANDVIKLAPEDTNVSFDYVLIEKTGDITELPVAVSEYGYATLCPSVGLDFTGTDIEAYIATEVSGSSVVLEQVNTVAAGEGVLLVAEGGATVNVPVAADAVKSTTNLFKGVTETIEALASEEGNVTNFILNVGEDIEAGFYLANGKTVAAGKAYLPVENYNAESTAKGLTLVFGNEATGISEVSAQKAAADNAYYTLSGVRVQQPTKGLYIVNGKKVVIR